MQTAICRAFESQRAWKRVSMETEGNVQMATAEFLKNEIETYERNKQNLLADGEGKYALIADGEVAGVWAAYEDALQAGYSKFGLRPFLVKQIQGIERVHSISRDVGPCQS